ncbi:hypothetical protein DE4587_02637 [Mycobacteroides salmoniphilum]|nr:hypothetical protein DE4586_00039 [Mycobacteroides salmoniphilum]TDZ86200.1 hypothetical protein DE4587_02637 [Mycobacteroides salmoniphilum]
MYAGVAAADAAGEDAGLLGVVGAEDEPPGIEGVEGTCASCRTCCGFLRSTRPGSRPGSSSWPGSSTPAGGASADSASPSTIGNQAGAESNTPQNVKPKGMKKASYAMRNSSGPHAISAATGFLMKSSIMSWSVPSGLVRNRMS